MARSPSAKRVRRDAVAQRNARVTRRKVGQPVAAAPRGRAETELQMLLAQEQIRRVEIQQAFEERGAALESSTSAQDQLAAQLARACERNAELERALDDADRSLVVRVRVLAARNLRPPPTGAASPYATVVPVTPAGAPLDGDRCTATPPIADTRDPRWDGLPAVALGSRCCLKRCGFVRVELVASRPDPRPDEPLGSADVPIPPPGGATTAWVPLAPGASSALCLAHVLRKPQTYGDVLVEVANGVAPSTGLNA